MKIEAMSPELENAAKEATDAAKAEAWRTFVGEVVEYAQLETGRGPVTPADMRRLADAACEYAGVRVERHVAAEREACAALLEAQDPGLYRWAVSAIRARGQTTTVHAPPSVRTQTPAEVVSAGSPFDGHTPGPWQWDPANECVVGSLEGDLLDPDTVYTVYRVANVEDRRDGLLIAAAPTLLAEAAALTKRVAELNAEVTGTADNADRQRERAKAAERERDAHRAEVERVAAQRDGLREVMRAIVVHYEGAGAKRDMAFEAIAKFGGES